MKNTQRGFRTPLLWILLATVVIYGVISLAGRASGYNQVPTSQVLSILNGNEKLTEVTLVDNDQTIKVLTASGKKYQADWVGDQSNQIIDTLNKRIANNTLDHWNGENPTQGVWSSLLYSVVPFIIMAVLFLFFINMVQGRAGGGVMGFGKSKAKVATKDTPKTLFSDVAGCEEAIEELQEIREFLAEPAKFQRVGAKIPKGVLLYGPPGTGKTLLARAVAGEAGVPFFSISGSDFVEMFVGVGASRVRDLFDQAKEAAPAIIFIDEIDAVGRHRGAGLGGGHDEREQTLNQLLVEMDGFDVHGGVILIAATNRPDVLDPALLRPGRFDRQISVEAPDLKGREQILKVHSNGKPMAPGVNLASVARRTPGFTGADLANVLNEAALLTARLNLPVIDNAQLDEAIDRVIAGPQKRSRLMSEHEKLITAYHEGGHALVAAAMPGNDPVQKVTILPRGRALGYTMVLPDDDKYSSTRGELLDQMAYMLGGRAAEELVFHEPTTGASNDIEKVTQLARNMVTQYGMTERIGAVQLGSGDSEPFVGMGTGSTRDFSDITAAAVDEEVSKLINNAHQEAFDILNQNRSVLDELVRQLLEFETLDKAQVAKIFANLTMHPARGPWTGSDKRVPSDLPPIDPPKVQHPPAPNGAPPNGSSPVGAPQPGMPGGPYPPAGQPQPPYPGQQPVPPQSWGVPPQWAPPASGWAPPAWPQPGQEPQPPQTGPGWGPDGGPQPGPGLPQPGGPQHGDPQHGDPQPGGAEPGTPGPSGTPTRGQ